MTLSTANKLMFALVEKPIEISIGFLHIENWHMELHKVSMELHRNSP
jgi:hypothetical protein